MIRDSCDDVGYQFADIDQFNFAIHIDFGRFVVCKLVAKSGNHGVVIRVSERTEDVGYDKAGELGIAAACPQFEQFTAYLFGFAVEVVAFFLGGGGEKDVGC